MAETRDDARSARIEPVSSAEWGPILLFGFVYLLSAALVYSVTSGPPDLERWWSHFQISMGLVFFLAGPIVACGSMSFVILAPLAWPGSTRRVVWRNGFLLLELGVLGMLLSPLWKNASPLAAWIGVLLCAGYVALEVVRHPAASRSGQSDSLRYSFGCACACLTAFAAFYLWLLASESTEPGFLGALD